MDEAGHTHDPRGIMNRWIAIEPSSERFLQWLKTFDRQSVDKTPVGLIATFARLHHDMWLQLGVVHRLNRCAVEIGEQRADACDIGFLSPSAVGLVDGDIYASAARVLFD